MIIKDMFARDIDRKINGVIQVGQENAATVQEVNEYVVTNELRKHFLRFFSIYDEAFETPTNDIGVWISGFFGSGKSHFLKMLSYILSNQEVGGKKTVEWFRPKFADDPATFMLIDRAVKTPAETILFNIDVQGFSNKDKSAVIRVFTKMFYNHLGFYGENLKVARLESFVDRQGKTQEFRDTFKEINGGSWVETRQSFSFFEDDIRRTMEKVLGMSDQATRDWFNGTEKAEISIAQLVSEIKAYVDTKPKDFRLLFMADEVGQYVGEDTNLLLNLQSLVEELGRQCRGKVWVICTGQEALDKIIKARMDEFSRIQARFKTQLRLSSSAVGEVIQKRLLSKTDEASTVLADLYRRNDSILKNIFTFSDAVQDLKGYDGEQNFVADFPFVPYQFKLVQKIFDAIRTHGSIGKHNSGAERSMLDGFQLVARMVENKDEHTIAPLYPFYDSVHTILDGPIRRVVERCEEAAQHHDGIEPYDVNVLKLLYLIRYVGSEIKANLDNITILMVDNIGVDKVTLREKVRASLDRLQRQNYIDRRGDIYVFLTDEEQDIAREISNTSVTSASIVERIGQILFGDIYTQTKYSYKVYNLPFKKMVDDTIVGSTAGDMTLRFITAAADVGLEKNFTSQGNSTGEAVAVLADTPYYGTLEKALKITTYVKQRNVSQLPKSVQEIIRGQQDMAVELEEQAKAELEKAIIHATFYVDGEKLDLPTDNAPARIKQAMDALVEQVYKGLDYIDWNVANDGDIVNILHGKSQQVWGHDTNQRAAAEVLTFLNRRESRRMSTSMEDIQAEFGKVPYGWREIDIAAVVAYLLNQQKITLKYNGTAIRVGEKDGEIPDFLRKKSQRGRVMVSIRQSVTLQKMRKAAQILRSCFNLMNVPGDEEQLVATIIENFQEEDERLEALDKRYEGHTYPGRKEVRDALQVVTDILRQKEDNIALVDRLLIEEDRLLDAKDKLAPVDAFFASQVKVFNQAADMEKELRDDLHYIDKDPATKAALDEIRRITYAPKDASQVNREVPKLNGLMDTARKGHNKLLEVRRDELYEVVRQCLEAIHTEAEPAVKFKDEIKQADDYYSAMKKTIGTTLLIFRLNGLETGLWSFKDTLLARIQHKKNPPKPVAPQPVNPTVPVKPKTVRTYYRQALFPAETLSSQQDIDAYVEDIRGKLTDMLKTCDEIKLG